MSRYLFTIEPAHVEPKTWRGSRYGNRNEWARRAWKLRDAIGRVLPGDVGKHVYECEADDGSGRTFYQVENEEQRAARIARAETLRECYEYGAKRSH